MFVSFNNFKEITTSVKKTIHISQDKIELGEKKKDVGEKKGIESLPQTLIF